MLSRYSNELARKSTWTCISCAAATRTSQALITGSTKQSPAHVHQRKHSSSKTSSSPKDESRAIATPSEAPSKKPKSAAQEIMEKRPSSGASRRKSNNNDLSLNLPSVPSTGHVHPLDIQVSSFFSIHRPISVTTPIPTEQSPSAFSSIFEQKPPQKSKTADVIYTLSSAVNTLENAAANSHQQNAQHMTPEEIDLRQAVTQASSSNAEQTTHHLDIPAKTLHINLQELAKNFRPFMPPPVPIPIDSDSPHQQQVQQTESDTNNQTNEFQTSPPPTRKSYTTTLTIHEIISPTGQKIYKTHNTPVIEHLSPSSSGIKYFPPSPRNQPFLGRMRERQLQYIDRMMASSSEEGGENFLWQLISVKRQRKLKMKKHKYKKLMRRTKNLRRKLDRT